MISYIYSTNIDCQNDFVTIEMKLKYICAIIFCFIVSNDFHTLYYEHHPPKHFHQ